MRSAACGQTALGILTRGLNKSLQVRGARSTKNCDLCANSDRIDPSPIPPWVKARPPALRARELPPAPPPTRAMLTAWHSRLHTHTPARPHIALTVYHGGWSNAPPRQAGSARRDNPLQAYSPKFTLASRSVGCAISQNMASSTAWKASRTTCALGGVSRFKGKLAPATVGSAGVSYSPSRILSGHRRFGEGRRYRASVHRYSRE